MSDTALPPTVDELQQWLLISPFQRWLDIRASAITDHGIELLLPWREEMVSNPSGPGGAVMHGGVLASVIDLAGLYSLLARRIIAVSTVDLFVDYHAAVTRGELRVQTQVLRVGASVSTVRTEIFAGDDALVASGRGAYRMARSSG